MQSFFGVLCCGIALALMVMVGRKEHYRDSSNESYGRAVGRRITMAASIVLIIGFAFAGVFLLRS